MAAAPRRQARRPRRTRGYALNAGAALAVVAAALIVVVGRRWSTAWPLVATLLVLVLANGSIGGLKTVALHARWGALAATAGIFALELRRAKPGALRPLAPLAVLPLAGLVSAVWSVDPRLTLERSVSVGMLLLASAGIAVRWAREPEALRRGVDALAALSVAVFAASLVLAAVSGRAFLGGNIRGLFENPNGLGLFLGVTYPFVANALLVRGHRVAPFVVLAGYAATTVASRSRSGLVALLIVTLAAAVARRRRVRIALVVVLTLAVAGAIVALALPPRTGSPPPSGAATAVLETGAPASVGRVPQAHPSFVSRLTGARNEAWAASWRIIRLRPVEGYGFGTGDSLFARFPDLSRFVNFEGANPANAYVQLALELGIVGALVALLPLALAFRRAVLFLGRREELAPQGAFAAVVVAFAAVGVVESVFTSAGAPWELVLWPAAALCLLRVSPPLRAPAFVPLHRRIAHPRWVAAAMLLAAVGAAVAVVVPRLPHSKLAPLQPLAHRLAQLACGNRACSVHEASSIQGTFSWVELRGPHGRSCFVVDRTAFKLTSAKLEGVARARCAEPPLVRPHTLTVAILDPAPPYYIPPASRATGYEPALVRQLARRLGVGLITWVVAPGDRVPPRADVLVHVFYRGPRLPAALVPYLVLPAELVVRRGSGRRPPQTLRAVRDLRLGVIDETTARYLRRDVHVKRPPVLFATLEDAVAAVRTRSVDGLVLDLGSAGGVDNATTGLVPVASFPPRAFYTMRFRAGSSLRPLVARELAAMRKDGTLRRLQPLLGPVPRPVPALR